REGDVQIRSFPNAHGGQFATRGFEFISSLKLAENAERIAEEAVGLLSAKECPSAITTVILDGSQLALQIHESIGHPIELDRVLGTEISLAGGSFVTLDKLENFRYGSEIINVMADATIEGGLGSFGYDDEGVKAQRIRIIKDGVFMNYLTSRETALFVNQTSNGTMRADGWNKIPLIRMTNINLEPGDLKFEDLIADTDEGIYLETNKSWSIDDLRLNFQFATEIGWEIKKGKLGRMIKNPNYTGITPVFWNSCDTIVNRDSWQVWGLTNCGKGEPIQGAYVGHGASPARFKNVKIGAGK
ncbi:MAG: TldD/PmbA family protein, partial [Candidatus Subteraquimicrobiales bacterium]|nr:TldD/PmbA family protein [Candidatus Subteraquimicrobiales bacterium]